RGLCRFHRAQARLRTAEVLGQQLLDLAHRQHNAVLVLESHLAVGCVSFCLGDLVAARAYLEQSLGLCDTLQLPTPLFPNWYEPGVIHNSGFALVLWLLGYADQAQQRSQEALARAQQVGHTPSLAFAAVYASLLSQFRRAAATQARAAAFMTAVAAQGFGYRIEQGHILRGWALAVQGEAAAGGGVVAPGVAASEGTGSKALPPHI